MFDILNIGKIKGIKIRKPYHYVPPCPVCGSRRTGRYVARPMTMAGDFRENTLKDGELIRFRKSEPVNNAYCIDCNYEWPCDIRLKLWTGDRIEEEAAARGAKKMYQRYMQKKQELMPKEPPKKSLFGFGGDEQYSIDEVYMDDEVLEGTLSGHMDHYEEEEEDYEETDTELDDLDLSFLDEEEEEEH